MDTPEATGDRLLAAIAADPDLAALSVGTVMRLVRLVISEVSPSVIAEAEAAFREATTKAILAAADMLDVRAGTLLVKDTGAGMQLAATLLRESVEHERCTCSRFDVTGPDDAERVYVLGDPVGCAVHEQASRA